MTGVIESTDYATLDPRDILTDASPKVAARIRALVPSAHDMHRELQRWVRHNVDGVEFIQREHKPSRGLWLARDPDRMYSRHKRYGQVTLPMEEAYDDNLAPDVVRHRVFRLVEMMGVSLAAEVKAARESLLPPAGASVEYSRFTLGPWMPMTIRSTPGTLPRFMDTYGDNDGRVLTSLYTDEIVLRFAAYYFIAPTGEEMEFADD